MYTECVGVMNTLEFIKEYPGGLGTETRLGMIRYPWKDWMAPARYKVPQTINRGTDYFVQNYIMANTIRNRATLMGVRVSIKVHANGLTFVITPRRAIGKKR